ncbi:MAG TPA: murein biosynthesis integral membrane protein MurJ [Roseiflexaceae bacterium]|nr:murein biosynthesis integral membrane protein MurJ [Roseiflexaceae bacterium]
MTAQALAQGPRPEAPPVLLGGPAALAESAWMGAAQASDVLEPLRIAAPRWRPRDIRLPPLGALLTRELTVAEASVVLMASFFTSALLGAVRQVLFNAQFGAGMEASAYYAAFRLPDTLFSLIAGGALSSAMIPVLLGVRLQEGEAAGERLVRLVLTTLMAAFAALVLLAEVLAPVFVRNVLAPGFDEPTAALTVSLTRLMLIQPLILAVGSVATAVLNSRNQFALTALSIASHNIALLAGITAARLVPGLGIYGPALGVVGGGVLQVAILLPGLAARGFRFRPLWAPFDARLREIVRLLIPNGLSVGVNYAGFILDTAFASRAQGAALAAITNAWLLVGLPIALLGQAVGQSAFPRLAAHAEAGEWREMRRALLRALGAAVALAVPALLGLIVLGRVVIRVLFERGRFDTAAGDLTYLALVAYAAALPFYVGTEVVSRGLIALRDTRTPLLTNMLQIAGRAAILALFTPRFGLVAIPAAFAITSAAETLILATVLLLRLGRRVAVPLAAISP